MSDLISGNKIYNYIKAQINPYGKPFEGDVYEFGIKLMEYIEQMDAEESVTDTNIGSKWIPCSERLPEPNKAVLVSTNTGEIDVDYYGLKCKDFIGLKGTHLNAVAWMPLPEPYKGE